MSGCPGLSPLPLVKGTGLFSKPLSLSLSLTVPRHPSNDLFEIFEIERGVSADDEAKDDPGRCLFYLKLNLLG